MRIQNAVSFGLFSLFFFGAAIEVSAQSGWPVEFHDWLQYNGIKKKGPCDQENGDSGMGGAASQATSADQGGSGAAAGYPPGGCMVGGPGGASPGPNGSNITTAIHPGPLGPPGPGNGNASKSSQDGCGV